MRPPRLPFALLAGCCFCCFAAQAAGAQTPIPPQKAGVATIDGLVTDTTLVPIGGATISVLGSTLRVVTGENGRFRISALPPGQYIVLAHRLGFEPMSAQLQLTEADTQRVSFTLERLTARLDTVVVTAPRVPARLEEFESRRRNHEASASFNRDDILKVNPVATWEMLSRVPSVKFVASGSALLAVSGRGLIAIWTR